MKMINIRIILLSIIILIMGCSNNPTSPEYSCIELWGECYNIEETTQLYLVGNQLDSIPPEIGQLTNLTTLGLHSCYLTGGIPPEIGNLVNLTWLDLGENQLTGEIPSEIGNLTNLTWLGLEFNKLSGQIPESICDIYQNVTQGGVSQLRITSNNLCPPYPECLTERDIGFQIPKDCDNN